MKRNSIFVVLLIIGFLFEAICFVGISQRSAEKKNLYSFYLNDSDKSVVFGKKSVNSNKRNPLYKLNLSCLYAKKDAMVYSIFKSLFHGDTICFSDIPIINELLTEAHSMSPQEPIFALNYSLIKMIQGEKESAQTILDPFANEAFATREILLVEGMLNELNGNRMDASYYYSKAIARFTDITESVFWEDLRKRDPDLASQSFKDALERMVSLYNNGNDPIVAAKLGKLYYSGGDLEKAQSLLEYALQELPTLNRTWYYLGCIMEDKRDKALALKYFSKSFELDDTDVVPLKKLVNRRVFDMKKLDDLLQKKGSYQINRLGVIYGGSSIRQPYILSDLENYFSPNISD